MVSRIMILLFLCIALSVNAENAQLESIRQGRPPGHSLTFIMDTTSGITLKTKIMAGNILGIFGSRITHIERFILIPFSDEGLGNSSESTSFATFEDEVDMFSTSEGNNNCSSMSLPAIKKALMMTKNSSTSHIFVFANGIRSNNEWSKLVHDADEIQTQCRLSEKGRKQVLFFPTGNCGLDERGGSHREIFHEIATSCNGHVIELQPLHYVFNVMDFLLWLMRPNVYFLPVTQENTWRSQSLPNTTSTSFWTFFDGYLTDWLVSTSGCNRLFDSFDSKGDVLSPRSPMMVNLECLTVARVTNMSKFNELTVSVVSESEPLCINCVRVMGILNATTFVSFEYGFTLTNKLEEFFLNGEAEALDIFTNVYSKLPFTGVRNFIYLKPVPYGINSTSAVDRVILTTCELVSAYDDEIIENISLSRVSHSYYFYGSFDSGNRTTKFRLKVTGLEDGKPFQRIISPAMRPDPEALIVWTPRRLYTQRFGKNRNLHCFVESMAGQLNVSWHKNGKEITSTSVENTADVVLEISDFSREHLGFYECVASYKRSVTEMTKSFRTKVAVDMSEGHRPRSTRFVVLIVLILAQFVIY